ncbi:MAG: riboflavin synthase [Thermaurantimonas sp.]|uniref:riboflavin synthase n=1 Tax=Thermaurantimonas sp. TaxID=2681568 RepID=UPI00391D9F0D
MFTGIVETLGTITHIEHQGTNIHFTVQSDISSVLKIDQSVAHDGVCLTVTELPEPGFHKVTAIDETLRKTALKNWKIGTKVNLERAMVAGARLDGHLVQGHVDTTATLVHVEDVQGSWNMHFRHPIAPEFITVPKGSICVNGISLTVVIALDDGFSVSIIPYTWQHTNLQFLSPGDPVNVEFDILGKYIAKLFERYKSI